MDLQNSALTVGIAMAAGVGAQIVARHLGIPGIVLLLAAGVVLGPDGAGLIRPELLGDALHALVGFAVAVILFAGAMNLDLKRLSEERVAIRRLVTWGALVTGVGAALSVRALLDWDWRMSALFGSLVIVTGPTVVTPLVRRLRLREPVGTILEAEGVLIDPIGAIIAVVALEVLYAGANPLVSTFETVATALTAGALVGLGAGGLIVLLLRPRWLVPVGLENIFVLSIVMFTFQLSESARSESGLAAVVVAGLIVGNVRTRVSRELLEFKEQLTVFMIGVLFVLLAADVRLSDARALGWWGLGTVAALIVIVRPLQSWLCTVGANLRWQERAFLASMAPRGIVAAAVASLFAQYLTDREIPGGPALRALVFLVIAGTVVAYGLAGGVMANILGLRQTTGRGYAVLGCNPLSLALARALELEREEVTFVDSNIERVAEGRARGYSVIHGQGLRPEVIQALEPGTRTGCIALSPNEEVNLLFARGVREETRVPALYLALRRDSGGIAAETVRAAHASVLFGRPCELEVWMDGLGEGTVDVEVWARGDRSPPAASASPVGGSLDQEPSLLILAARRRGKRFPYGDVTALENAAEIVVAIDAHRREHAEAALTRHGFRPSAAASARVSWAVP
jgi:NhaP-type Na+/H+ or K+/H+ antiporter